MPRSIGSLGCANGARIGSSMDQNDLKIAILEMLEAHFKAIRAEMWKQSNLDYYKDDLTRCSEKFVEMLLSHLQERLNQHEN